MSWAGRLYLSLEAQAQLRITDRYSIHRVIQELFEYQKYSCVIVYLQSTSFIRMTMCVQIMQTAVSHFAQRV